MNVAKLHTVYQNKHSPWLRKRHNCDADGSTEAKTICENLFFRVMNKSFYEKFLENRRKRINLDLLEKTNVQIILHRQSKTTFIDKSGDFKKLFLNSSFKENILLTKPFDVGFCKLKSSKVALYL